MWAAQAPSEPRKSPGCWVVREGFLWEETDKLDLKAGKK